MAFRYDIVKEMSPFYSVEIPNELAIVRLNMNTYLDTL